ncbi:MAG TPA: response regulator [Thermomicrobiaceae bacterium]|nr:response regulator [Thermomicrobiaceae bacterium]
MEAPIAKAQIERHAPSVLIVDDDPDISRIIALALQDSGYDIVIAADLSEAESAVRSHGVDLIVCDLFLPDGLGSELLHRISEPPRYPRSPASILMSSHPDVSQHAKQVHADAYLPKPFDLDELCSTVDRLLSRNDGV